jgi:hypothetical protein
VTTAKDVFGILNEVNDRTLSTLPDPAIVQHLADLGLVAYLTADQYHELETEVAALGAAQVALQQAIAERARLAAGLQEDFEKTHSVLFHLHGQDKQSAELQQTANDRASLQALEADLAKQQQAFNDLVAKRTLHDSLIACGDRYIGLTGLGQLQVRDLGVRLYRVGDADFDAYWAEATRIAQRLNALADVGASYYARLQVALPGADRAYLWAIALGLSRTQPDPDPGTARFAEAFNAVVGLTTNLENRLMASEILFSIPRSFADELPALTGLNRDVHSLGVPEASSLGVAAILLFGQRGDGTFATANLADYLHLTRSFESAALLAIMNQPISDLTTKFRSMEAMFASWGYEASEDVELSAAYLTVSELPADGIGTKLAIVARGLRAYLEYPLVAAAVLSSVSTLEANETLNLLEQAYNVVGRRAGGLSQPELICVAVRLIEGIRQELVGSLDTTAAARPTAAPAPGYYPHPMFFFGPMVVFHGGYYSTFGGMTGAHPGHVHGFAGGGFGG